MNLFGGNMVMPIFIRIKLKLQKTGYFKFLRSKYIEPCKLSIIKRDLKSLISTMQVSVSQPGLRVASVPGFERTLQIRTSDIYAVTI